MLVILSPAKSFAKEITLPEVAYSQPELLSYSKKLMSKLQSLSKEELARLMKLSDELAELNSQRHRNWQPPFTTQNAMPAVLAFTGEAYRGLDATSLTTADLQYAQDHLRILSGLYGLLRPLDLIQPYRLEMGTKLAVGEHRNLYQFWGETLTEHINRLLEREKYLINLASNEYYKALNTRKINGTIITPVFKDFSKGAYKVLMTYAKNARGAMTRYIIQNRIENPELLKGFDANGYCYNPAESDANTLVFTRG